MSPRKDADPKNRRTAALIRRAPFPPDAPTAAKRTAAAAGRVRRGLLSRRKRGGR